MMHSASSRSGRLCTAAAGCCAAAAGEPRGSTLAGSSSPPSGGGGQAPIDWDDIVCKAFRVFVNVLCVAVLVLSYPLVTWIPVIGKVLWGAYALYLCVHVFFA